MDWNVAKNIAHKMVKICEKEVEAGHEGVTIIAGAIVFIVALEDSFKEADARSGATPPDNLEQVYAWARDCLDSMLRAFPPETGKPN